MKINILKARIERNNFKSYAKNYFMDENSLIVKELKAEGKEALLGIKKNDKTYTILGEKFVYYSLPSRQKGKLLLCSFSNLLHKEAMRKGKLFVSYKYLKIGNGEKIWINNRKTMEAMWNTVLYLIDNSSNIEKE